MAAGSASGEVGVAVTSKELLPGARKIAPTGFAQAVDNLSR
jgi:hypothetical protein